MDSKEQKLRKEQGARLRKAREAFLGTGSTASDGAALLKVSRDSYLQHENGTRSYIKNWAEKYAGAYGVSAAWLAFGEGDLSQKSDNGLSLYGANRLIPLQPEREKSSLQTPLYTHNVTVKGRVKAGTWLAMKEYDQDLGTVLFNAPSLRGKTLYGLIVEGKSVNLKYPEGTTVIIAKIYDRRPKNKDFVVLRNYIAVDIAEMTLKQAIKGNDGIVRYYCCSDDPEYRDAQPIVIPPRDEFAQLGYEVIGSVVGAVPRHDESEEEELPI